MILVGTSGYNYPEWKGSFYPQDLPAAKMLPFYAERFPSVEINASFYRMPTPKVVAGWAAQVPPSFRFTLKANRRITHDRRLKDVGDSVDFFVKSARELGPQLGTVLFQTPPNLKCNFEVFDAFLATVPEGLEAAFEFRNDSWLTDEIFGLLANRKVALCIADFGDKTTPVRVTAPHGYFRLRDEGYTPADLEKWANVIADQGGDWQEVFVYFKHEDEGKGPEFARAFLEILASRGLIAR